eukprot:5187510-Pleurochrysis_carterae.AAC.1
MEIGGAACEEDCTCLSTQSADDTALITLMGSASFTTESPEPTLPDAESQFSCNESTSSPSAPLVHEDAEHVAGAAEQAAGEAGVLNDAVEVQNSAYVVPQEEADPAMVTLLGSASFASECADQPPPPQEEGGMAFSEEASIEPATS